MKRINKKGFTLIELLAVIIILGVLLLIAVPSVSKYIQDSRMKTYNNNLANFASAVANEVNAMDFSSVYNFSSTQALVIPFEKIELEKGSNTKSPFNMYNQDYSYVLVVRKYDGDGNPVGFNYYIQAMDENGYGSKIALNGATKIEAVKVADLTAVPTDGAAVDTVDFHGLVTLPEGVETFKVVG